ncbi:conserved membrane domain protein [Mycobacterium ulcerans str. Harvey]|uniref:Conserved membrane domain protein n=1 Tax=Mycobacterium ulcerans str. Harvey TaxID=1299332 RepID=A0ABN0QUG1_MYCUL|nr:conserved membrane domain protein [Mycobacterium ulcerans str. Harvey]
MTSRPIDVSLAAGNVGYTIVAVRPTKADPYVVAGVQPGGRPHDQQLFAAAATGYPVAAGSE